MPEGPPIFYLKEKLKPLEGNIVKEISSNKVPTGILIDKRITEITSHGKNLIIGFSDYFITIHLGMDGEIDLNGKRPVTPDFTMVTDKNCMNAYWVRTTFYNYNYKETFDWKTDIMSEAFDAAHICTLVRRKYGQQQIVDTLMNQKVFSGVGNIIKNEVLFRCQTHPESINNMIPADKLLEIVEDCKRYGYIFYDRLKEGNFYERTHVYDKKKCPIHHTILKKYIYGKDHRVNFVCEKCQKLYAPQQPEIL